MQRAIETHYISCEPEIKVKILRRKHQEIHNVVPVVSPLNLMMRKYDAVTKLIVMQKNWLTAFEKDFGEHLTPSFCNSGECEKVFTAGVMWK